LDSCPASRASAVNSRSVREMPADDCESTARDAYYRDYRVFFLADGTGSITEEMHLASLLNLAFGFAYITTSDAILAQLARES